MTKQLDYKKNYHEAVILNLDQVRALVLNNDRDMEIKITNYSNKYDLPILFIRNKILKDNIFANQFAKDPSKQTFHQNLASDFISSLEGVKDFKTLPANGKNALYIIDGKLGKENEIVKGTSKSIDFYWRFNGYECYAAHKYTDVDGGSQDNQYTDLIDFLKNASLSKEKKTIFFAIGDGDYYQRKHTKTKNEYNNKIEYMNGLYGTKHSVALTINELEEWMQTNLKSED